MFLHHFMAKSWHKRQINTFLHILSTARCFENHSKNGGGIGYLPLETHLCSCSIIILNESRHNRLSYSVRRSSSPHEKNICATLTGSGSISLCSIETDFRFFFFFVFFFLLFFCCCFLCCCCFFFFCLFVCLFVCFFFVLFFVFFLFVFCFFLLLLLFFLFFFCCFFVCFFLFFFAIWSPIFSSFLFPLPLLFFFFLCIFTERLFGSRSFGVGGVALSRQCGKMNFLKAKNLRFFRTLDDSTVLSIYAVLLIVIPRTVCVLMYPNVLNV